jgi:Flp pilus assembly protein TadB
VALFFVFYLIAPARTGLMISHPIGLMITGFAITLIAVGGYFIKKIVTIEV